jgi:hypothetical protein
MATITSIDELEAIYGLPGDTSTPQVCQLLGKY